MRDETFPNLDPTHPDGPRGLHSLAAAGPRRPVPEPARDILNGRTLPAVPDWVQDRAKWVSLDRTTRRRLLREHERRTRA